MIRLEKRTIEALARLHHDSDFTEVLAWVESSLRQELLDLVMSKNTDEMLRTQGVCRAFTELLEHAGNARDILRKTGR